MGRVGTQRKDLALRRHVRGFTPYHPSIVTNFIDSLELSDKLYNLRSIFF